MELPAVLLAGGLGVLHFALGLARWRGIRRNIVLARPERREGIWLP